MNSQTFSKCLTLVSVLTAVFIMTTLTFSVELAHADKANLEDPKLESDNVRINAGVDNAQSLTPGIPCPTGACFKDAHPENGYGEKQIVPQDSTADTKPKESDTVN